MPTLIIEDGTMPEGANSYASVADCDAWQAARGNAEWVDADDADKEAALIRAMDFLNGLRWKGKRAAPGRVLSWPRVEVVDGDGYEVALNTIPPAVVSAQCYLAGVAVSGTDLQPILERGGAIKREKVSTLETEYFEGAPVRDAFTVIADLLHGLAAGLDGVQGDSGSSSGMSVIEVVRA